MNKLFKKQSLKKSSTLHFIFLLFIYLFLGPGMVPCIKAQLYTNPRALSMGNAYTAVGRNLESSAVNPANLGLKSPRKFYLLIPIMPSLYLDIHNTSFNLGDVDKYSGKYLSKSDKNEILDQVSDGLGFRGDFCTDLFGFSFGRFAMNVSLDVFSSFYLPHAPLDLLLNGNDIKKNFSFRDLKGDSQTALVTAFSYAHPLDGFEFMQPVIQPLGLTRTSAGITVKYLAGLANAQVRTHKGNINFDDFYLNGAGETTVRAAGTKMTNTDDEIEFDFTPGVLGKGLAFDLGLAASRGDRLSFGIAIRNLIGGITWNKDTYEAKYTGVADSLNIVAAAQDTTDGDQFYSHSDTSYAIGSYKTDLPTTLSIGAAYQLELPPNIIFKIFAKNITAAVDIEKGFSDTFYSSKKMRLSFGLEQGFLWGRLPLRYGLSFGGGDNTVVSCGLGFNLPGFKWDLGFMNYGGFTDTKGLRMSTRFWFGS